MNAAVLSGRFWLRVIKGWLSGCVTATIAAEVCFIVASMWENYRANVLPAASDYLMGFGITAPFVLLVIGVLTAIPAVIVIGLTERFRVRSLLFYVCSGGVTGGLGQSLLELSFFRIWVFALAGCAAGLIYWYVAGRHAGRDHPTGEDG
ncbi:hypothetical protein [Bradyrhizobium neotropicale]|uniref:hypothetical protein n=1 Tax=Bradyrhizobium neotropicale TaxID=1497615 RepID=UPI000A79B9CA|nr:hypothetical protein [Bradyrhizobium neotropicale]